MKNVENENTHVHYVIAPSPVFAIKLDIKSPTSVKTKEKLFLKFKNYHKTILKFVHKLNKKHIFFVYHTFFKANFIKHGLNKC